MVCCRVYECTFGQSNSRVNDRLIQLTACGSVKSGSSLRVREMARAATETAVTASIISDGVRETKP